MIALLGILLVPSVGSGQATTSDAEARGLFLAGQAAYSEARYADALRHFQRSYELSGRPDLLYNVAQAADRLRRDDIAIAAFEAYLHFSPTAERRREVESRLAILRARIGEPRADEPDGDSPGAGERAADAAPTPGGTHRGIAADGASPLWEPWLLGAASAALVILGVALLSLSATDAEAVATSAAGASFGAIRERYERIPVLTGVGTAALALGVVGIVGGVVWLSLGSSSGGGLDATAHARLAW